MTCFQVEYYPKKFIELNFLIVSVLYTMFWLAKSANQSEHRSKIFHIKIHKKGYNSKPQDSQSDSKS